MNTANSCIEPPCSEEALLHRADQLAGRNLGSIADDLGQPWPRSSVHGKGWPGQIIERALGADADSRPLPDFISLGIELKTIPVSATGQPLESTYVCKVAMDGSDSLHFEHSHLWRKLRRILWVPILIPHEGAAVAKRLVGAPTLWSPTSDQQRTLRNDWEEISGLIACGQGHCVTAHYGTVLQIRPKGANAADRVKGITTDGSRRSVSPRAFYLRPSFTASVLAAAYSLPSR